LRDWLGCHDLRLIWRAGNGSTENANVRWLHLAT